MYLMAAAKPSSSHVFISLLKSRLEDHENSFTCSKKPEFALF